MENFITSYGYLVIAAITFIVWLIRLEGKVKKHDGDIKNNEEDIEAIQGDNKEEIREINHKLDNMTTELTKICISFSELSGYIKGKECKE